MLEVAFDSCPFANLRLTAEGSLSYVMRCDTEIVNANPFDYDTDDKLTVAKL